MAPVVFPHELYNHKVHQYLPHTPRTTCHTLSDHTSATLLSLFSK